MARAKEITGLDCRADAASGIRLVLGTRLEEMCELRASALEWSDMEGVHDMRVASRRLRSALRDFAPLLRRRRLARVRNELKKIADALGAVRDEDVAIMALENLAADAPAEIAVNIMLLADERRGERETARARLREAITEEALAGLQEEFTGALDDALRSKRGGRKSAKDRKAARSVSFREAGRDIALSRFEELQNLSESLYRPFAPAPLHRMRIAAKRLRYALELFAPCWEAASSSLAEEVAEMQTSLGELHDCDVWIEGLGARLKTEDRKTKTGDGVSAEAQQRRAVAWLLGHFVKWRSRHFRDALTRLIKWEENGFATQLTAALTAQPTPIILRPISLTAVEAVASDREAQGKAASADT